MGDHEMSLEVRRRLAELRGDRDREPRMLYVMGFQPFCDNEISPRQSFDFRDPIDGTDWDVTINETDRNMWVLVLLDRTRGILSDVSGSTYITPEEAYRAAHVAAGGVLPAV